jgi:hypothetical protein
MRKTENHSNRSIIITYTKIFLSIPIGSNVQGWTAAHHSPLQSLITKLFKYSKYRMFKENSTALYTAGALSAA